MSSRRAATHKASDVLQNRHPYEPVSFEIDPNKVAFAFGHRKLSKIRELLENENLTPAQKLETLNLLEPILSNQEVKMRALDENLPTIVAGFLIFDNFPIKAASARIVGNFSTIPQGILPLSEGNVVEHLGDLLHENDFYVKTSAAGALLKMSDSIEGKKLIVSSPSCIESIKSALLFPSIEVDVAGILFNISEHDEASDAISSGGTLNLLMNTAERFHKTARSQKAACLALQAISNCVRTEIGRKEGVEHMFVVRLAELVKSTFEKNPFTPSLGPGEITLEILNSILEETKILQPEKEQIWVDTEVPIGASDGWGVLTLRATSLCILASLLLSLEGRKSALPQNTQLLTNDLKKAVYESALADAIPVHGKKKPVPASSSSSSSPSSDTIEIPVVELLVECLLSCEPHTSWHAFAAVAFLCELPVGKRAFLRQMHIKNANPELIESVLKRVGKENKYL